MIRRRKKGGKQGYDACLGQEARAKQGVTGGKCKSLTLQAYFKVVFKGMRLTNCAIPCRGNRVRAVFSFEFVHRVEGFKMHPEVVEIRRVSGSEPAVLKSANW